MSKKVDYLICSTPDKPLIYVLHGKNGDMLIDTGWKTNREEIDNWLTENNFDIKFIFLTHGHCDHTQNARYFKDKFNAKLIIHERDIDIFRCEKYYDLFSTDGEKTIPPDELRAMAMQPIEYCDIDYAVTDNDTGLLRTLGFDADIIILPGHSYGSIGIKHNRVVYSGDACSAIRGDYHTALIGCDLKQLLESEKKVFELNPLVIASGHGKLVINERAFGSK